MRWLALMLIAGCAAAAAQTPDLAPDRNDLAEPLVPTIRFSFDMPGATPDYYAIAVNRNARAAYTSHGRPTVTAETTPGDPYMVKFTMTDELRDRIFALAEKANRFRGEFDYKKGNIANMGRKTLVYEDGADRWETDYNWSQNPAIQELTTIFRGISNTFEGARRIQHLRRHDRLGLDAEMRHLEELSKRGELLEVHAIAPLLREIAADASIMHIARQRAEKILRKAESADARPAGNVR
jgi:hypothetical protein